MELRVKYGGIRSYELARGREIELGSGTALGWTRLYLFYQFRGGWLGGEAIDISFQEKGLGVGDYLLLDR
jgi:hypothetical protein